MQSWSLCIISLKCHMILQKFIIIIINVVLLTVVLLHFYKKKNQDNFIDNSKE